MYKSQIEAVLGLDAQSRRTFKGVFAIDKLPTKCEKDSSYVINYDEHDEVGSHWIAVYKDKKGKKKLICLILLATHHLMSDSAILLDKHFLTILINYNLI